MANRGAYRICLRLVGPRVVLRRVDHDRPSIAVVIGPQSVHTTMTALFDLLASLRRRTARTDCTVLVEVPLSDLEMTVGSFISSLNLVFIAKNIGFVTS